MKNLFGRHLIESSLRPVRSLRVSARSIRILSALSKCLPAS